MDVKVTRAVVATLMKEAAKSAPEECCGLLFGGREDGGAARIEGAQGSVNVAQDRLTRFEIDPLALLAAHKQERAGGPQVVGYYHSHPTGHPVPSATDCEHSTGDSRIWAIIAGSEVAFWRDSEEGFAPLVAGIVD